MAAQQSESQYESAQRMYSARAADYEASWHPDYSKRFVALANVKPGARILDLACGTGLEAELLAPLVGDEGIIVGVDATAAMLDVARQKQADNPVLAKRLVLREHDITDLTGCEGVEKGTFDWIMCSNAFVLLNDPGAVIAHWREYLKEHGAMLIDITHEHNLRQGLIMEKVARRLGLDFPSNRSWIKDAQSFHNVLQSKDMEVEDMKLLEKEPGKGSKFYDVSEAEEQFDFIANSPLTKMFTSDELRAKALPLFKEEWEAAAVDGKVEVSDSLYVYKALKIL